MGGLLAVLARHLHDATHSSQAQVPVGATMRAVRVIGVIVHETKIRPSPKSDDSIFSPGTSECFFVNRFTSATLFNENEMKENAFLFAPRQRVNL